MLTSVRRGLLLEYGCQVFGDTSGDVDDEGPRFSFYILEHIISP